MIFFSSAIESRVCHVAAIVALASHAKTGNTSMDCLYAETAKHVFKFSWQGCWHRLDPLPRYLTNTLARLALTFSAGQSMASIAAGVQRERCFKFKLPSCVSSVGFAHSPPFARSYCGRILISAIRCGLLRPHPPTAADRRPGGRLQGGHPRLHWRRPRGPP